MKTVHWTIKAKHRLRDIQEHIAIDNPTAALKMVPDYQRKDVRELGEHPYRIIYRK